MISVVIADDHDIYRHGLSMLLHDDERFRLIGEAKDGEEALDLIKLHKPDVALLDLSMPGAGGIEITARLQAENIPTNSIILSLNDDPDKTQLSMKVGAKGVINRDSAYEKLAHAIEFVSTGRVYSADFPKDSQMYSHSPIQSLSKREQDILKCVAQGMTSKQIGDKLCISHRTVDTHRMKIMQKLDIHNGPGLTKFALESGLLNNSEPS